MVITCAILLDERSRWILWVPVGLGIGISLYFSLTFEPSWLPILAGLFFAITAFLWLKRYPSAYFFGLIISCISIGFTTAKIRTAIVDTHMLNEKVSASFYATVIDIEKFPDKTRLILAPLKQPDLPQRVRLNAKITPEPGDSVSVTADLLPLSNPVSPYGYNFRRAAYFQGIGAVGRVKTLEITQKSDHWLSRWRYQLTEKLKQAIPGESGAIAAALITGDRAGISQTTRQAYADAGIAHILAISGLHLSIVAALGFLAIRGGFCLIPSLVERYPIKKWAAISAIMLTAFYLSISGFAVPAKRAFVMTTLVMLGILVDRRALSMRSLAFAATGILLIWPEVLLSASFQLSFAAVIALIAAYEWKGLAFHQWTLGNSWWRKIVFYIGGILFSTLIATIATTPFTIAIFNRFTIQAVISNLLAIPLTGLWIMPCAVLSVISGWTPFLQAFKLGLDLLTSIAYWTASLPGAAILIPTPSPFFLIFIIFGGLWLCLWQQAWRWWGFLPLCLGALMPFITTPPDILLAEDRSTLAVRQGNVLWVSPGRQSTFYQELWMKEQGLKEKTPWPAPYYTLNDIVFIDQSARRLPYRQIHQLCQQHTLVITNGRLPKSCKSAHIIDATSLRAEGSQLLWSHTKRRVTLAQTLGNRPWVKAQVK